MPDEEPRPTSALSEAQAALDRIATFFRNAGDSDSSLMEAASIRWGLIGTLDRLAVALEAIAEWEPRDAERHAQLAERDRAAFPDEDFAFSDAEEFAYTQQATSEMYLQAKALRYVRVLLGHPGQIDLERLEVPA